jgi:hypothetical protein
VIEAVHGVSFSVLTSTRTDSFGGGDCYDSILLQKKVLRLGFRLKHLFLRV